MSVNASAARVVGFHVEDPAERHEILAMLGLVLEDGTLAPDDTRSISVEDLTSNGGHAALDGKHRPRESTAPASLRVLPPVVAAPRKPVAVTPKKRAPRPGQ